MLNWLFGKPRCPVHERDKKWIETRFNWLTDQLGLERLLNGRTILPTEEFLPLEFDATQTGIQDLMCRVATYMDVNPATLNLLYCSNRGETDYLPFGPNQEREGTFNIWLETETLADPDGVIGALAHEIGHVLLAGQNRISDKEPDYEDLADLLSVFLGLGIFPANAVVHESHSRFGKSYSSRMARRGYLNMDEFGYALSLYTLARRDPHPEWASHLRQDVRVALKTGVRYIQATQDCEFLPALHGQVK